jgi:hypothetical protein
MGYYGDLASYLYAGQNAQNAVGGLQAGLADVQVNYGNQLQNTFGEFPTVYFDPRTMQYTRYDGMTAIQTFKRVEDDPIPEPKSEKIRKIMLEDDEDL